MLRVRLFNRSRVRTAQSAALSRSASASQKEPVRDPPAPLNGSHCPM